MRSKIKAFLAKYQAVAASPTTGRPDYTTAILSRLVEIADTLASAYVTAGDKDRVFIARDLSDIQFEVNVRFTLGLKADVFDAEANRAFTHLLAIHMDAGINCQYAVEQVWAEAARR